MNMQSITRFFNVGIPVKRCNFRCHYCYIEKSPAPEPSLNETPGVPLAVMKAAFSPERLGGACMFNLCAEGETLLFGELPALTELLLGLGHFVSIVTNAALTEPLEKIATIRADLRARLFIKCSFHYLELKRLGLLTQFFENVAMLKRNTIAFTIEMTANDESIPLIPDIQAVCLEQAGALCHIIESRREYDQSWARLTRLPLEEHQRAWAAFHSPLFEYQQATFEKHQPNFCYAGDYYASLDLQSGDMSPCPHAKKFANIYENPDAPIVWVAIAHCHLPHCYIAYHAGYPLAGCFEGASGPSYAQERDRVCADGTSWLTPCIREAFSRRCCEFHTPYSREKMFFLSMLMKKAYRNADPSPQEARRLTSILEKSLLPYPNIAVYGAGAVGQWLIALLEPSRIQVAFALDRRAQELPDFPLEIRPPNAPLSPADIVIVSVYPEFAGSARALERQGVPIRSIVDLVF